MRIFNGLDRTDYQDILRAIGHTIDEHGWHHVRLIECEEGLILQYSTHPTVPKFEACLFDDNDLQEMLHQAYARRTRGSADLPPPPSPRPFSSSESSS